MSAVRSLSGVIQTVFENSEAARKEALAICADLGRDIFAGLESGSDWQMHVTDGERGSYFPDQALLMGFCVRPPCLAASFTGIQCQEKS
jgi:hypothetical protein